MPVVRRPALLRARAAVAAAIVALAPMSLLIGPAHAAPTATITGHVVDQNGKPLAGIEMDAFPENGDANADATTSSTGAYTMSVGWTGTTSLQSFDPAAAHRPYSWDGTKAVVGLGASFTLGAGTTTADFVTPEAHRMTVTALDPSGRPIPYAGDVWQFKEPGDDTWQELQYGPQTTDETGSFTHFTDVGTTYRFCINDDYYEEAETGDRTERYVPQCYQGASTIYKATKIRVTASTPLDQRFVLHMVSAGRSMNPVEPFITGAPKVGSTLRVNTGVWKPYGTSLSFRWFYYDDNFVRHYIAGATGSTYVVGSVVAGNDVIAEVTGSAPGYASAKQYDSVGPVGPKQAKTSAPMTITGSGVVGQALTAHVGTETPAADGYKFEWLVGGRPVPPLRQGSDGDNTFTPQAEDVGKKVTVRYQSYRSGYPDFRQTATGPTVTRG